MKSYEKRIKNIEAKIKPKEPSYMERLDEQLLQAKRRRATLPPEGREWLKVHRPLLDAMLDKVRTHSKKQSQYQIWRITDDIPI